MTAAKLKRLEVLYSNRDANFYKWREFVETNGIDAMLEGLGFSTNRNALWYNAYTGHIETLNDLITTKSMGGTVSAEEQTEEFAMVLEHWLPQAGDSNPILDRAKALTEEQVKVRAGEYLKHYIEEAPTPEAFINRVSDQGATMEDGSFTISPRTRANIRVYLHDDREFTFPLRAIYHLIKRREEQPSLF
jgi:hypothetical protein